MSDTGQSLHVLTLNSGSSSLKVGLSVVTAARTVALFHGEAQFGDGTGRLRMRDAHRSELPTGNVSITDQADAITCVAEWLTECGAPAPTVIAHRVVHGGSPRRQHCVIDEALLAQLHASTDLAPLHIPSTLLLIRRAQALFPGLPQVACFDSTFHASLPAVARVLPIDRTLRADGLQRFGFHGLSCESIVHRLSDDLPDRLIIAHLGNGASVTAVKGGVSIDTSMGMTPNGGVIMGTRSGDLDPGVLVYLARAHGFNASALEDLVDHRSGLLGISGVSGDMRRLHALAPAHADARLAIDMFCLSVRKQVAAMAASLDGADMLVFTGGIGEHDAEVRRTVCTGLSWMGVTPDDAGPTAAGASRCVVRVLASRENEQMVRHAWRLLAAPIQ